MQNPKAMGTGRFFRLILGFPIPRTAEGEPHEIHRQGIYVPDWSAIKTAGKFRSNLRQSLIIRDVKKVIDSFFWPLSIYTMTISGQNTAKFGHYDAQREQEGLHGVPCLLKNHIQDWEKNRATPTFRYLPKIIELLGYFPYAPEWSPEKALTMARRLGVR